MPVAPFGLGLDRFAEGNLRFLGLDFQLVATRQPFPNDRQVQLAHAGHHQFFGLSVAVEPERRIFFHDLVQVRRTAWFRRRDSWAMTASPTIGVGNWIGGKP